MIEGKKILQFIGVVVMILCITFILSWVELLSRAKDSYNEGNNFLSKAETAYKANNIEDAYNNYREALWAFQTIEQLLTSGTRKYVSPDILEPGMVLADPIYPDGLRDAEIERQKPKEMITDSYVPLTADKIELIKKYSSAIKEVTIPESYSVTQNSSWILLSKDKITYCKEMIERTRPLNM